MPSDNGPILHRDDDEMKMLNRLSFIVRNGHGEIHEIRSQIQTHFAETTKGI
ncbi:ABC multidrug transporter [Aspergillus luchuensis]|uniref:ABC multidrug transporter n=1 Tax=Aspergillus kawachii TaxID=1069201 RepID=A0A146FR84_ASPKA|nr:ABC multidrug transporter [Aspergillus luchuensis]